MSIRIGRRPQTIGEKPTRRRRLRQPRMLLDQTLRGDEVRSASSTAFLAEYAEAETQLRSKQEALESLSRRSSETRKKALRKAIARLTVQVHALETPAA